MRNEQRSNAAQRPRSRYLPRHFEQHDGAALQALMQQHPLTTLVTPSADGITADHFPLQYRH